MYMLKSNGGSGTVKDCQFSNFIGHSNAYTLDLNAFWSSEKVQSGSGVQYSNLTFDSWKGTCADGTKRAPMDVVCPADVPCTGLPSMILRSGRRVAVVCCGSVRMLSGVGGVWILG
jgi:rhamnogalacturonan hydrolase